jgi:kinetochor protein Mis14/NSL1
MSSSTGNIFDSLTHLPGARATESAHRKVELQAPADLTYLIANVTRAAREKIDRHLPPDAVPVGEDAMRKRVEELVDEYIQRTFGAAKDNVEINGMGSREMEVELGKAAEGEGECIYQETERGSG